MLSERSQTQKVIYDFIYKTYPDEANLQRSEVDKWLLRAR